MLTPQAMALIVADLLEDGRVVEIVNCAVFDPAATVTLAGTVAYDELDDSCTTVPPVGAVPVSVTVPVTELPPLTLEEESDTE